MAKKKTSPKKKAVKIVKSDEIKPENLVTVTRDIPGIYDGKRIYCVVADTVQTHLDTTGRVGRANLWPPKQTIRRTELTKDVEQPAGRLIAQAAHVVSKVRHNMLKAEIIRATKVAKGKQAWYRTHILFFEGVTTIVLAARDSFELYHVKNLLKDAQIGHESFYDENDPVYGTDQKVMTAVATVPVDSVDVQGILDYLHLWKPKHLYQIVQEQHADEL